MASPFFAVMKYPLIYFGANIWKPILDKNVGQK